MEFCAECCAEYQFMGVRVFLWGADIFQISYARYLMVKHHTFRFLFHWMGILDYVFFISRNSHSRSEYIKIRQRGSLTMILSLAFRQSPAIRVPNTEI